MDSPARWQPSRAGILNVYQYQDEVLDFGGGRLLLRGVNGSGKSTAMNMLLPFLLEADVRKIDAAGEQRGVLRSWMLSDNEDTQRTGYLWIEFVRAGEYRTVGCGIRANRSTDRVTTWWFSTDRRARLDFRLTEADVPFSADALRSELGTRGQVFTSTAEYRAEVARRFFGGTDPTAYFRLLHQVRNPRVGDRIDTDLPRTLREALPPVPEDAVNDAAQPLEDLEDHRRNVTDLATTAEALDGVVEVYTDYARRVLMTAVEGAAAAVDAARTATRRVERERNAAQRATTARDEAVRVVGELTDEHARATSERQGLVSLPEYSAHADLVRRRDELSRADEAAGTLDGVRGRALARVTTAAGSAAGAKGQVESDLAGVAEHLREVATAARAASAPVRLPDPPALVTEPRDDAASGTSLDVPEDGGTEPAEDLPAALVGVADGLRTHRTTIRDLRERAGAADRETASAARAEDEAAEAGERAAEAAEQADVARRAARVAADEHTEAVAAWQERFRAHLAAVPAAEPGGTAGWLPAPAREAEGEPVDDLRARAEALVGAARRAADDASGALSAARARATGRVGEVDDELAALRAEHARVEAAGELPLPREPWRTDAGVDDAVLFASLVDFADDLDDAARAGLEAALEASGLLAARVDPDGQLRGEGGELLVTAGHPVGPGPRLVPVDTGTVPVEVVAGVLGALGTAPGAALWVGEDGSFGAGPLRGRHTKPAAEYVGAGAREQARARRLAELAAQVDDAESRLAAARGVAEALDEHAETLRRLVRELPGTRTVDDAVVAATGADRYAQEARGRAAERTAAAAEARRRADDAVARLQQEAAETGLPTDPERLEGLLEAITDAERALAAVEAAGERVRRSTRSWREAITAWEREVTDLGAAVADHRAAAGHAASVRTELETAESALGEEPAKVAARVTELDGHLRETAGRVDAAREEQTTATVAVREAELRVESARETLAEREKAAVGARARLVDALEVPGLLAAAEREPAAGGDPAPSARTGRSSPSSVTNGPFVPEGGDGESADSAADWSEEPMPVTPDTVEGAAELVDALRERLPAPRRQVTEDALEKALRETRDRLASGWDIESRRGRDGADGTPLAVHVTGPTRAVLAQMVHRVAVQRRRATSLLSAQQDQALRNLLHGRIAREVADALFAAGELVERMNRILRGVTSSQGIGVRLQWRPRGDLESETATALELLGKHPDLRSPEEDDQVREAVKTLVEQARAADPEASYRTVISDVLDYRTWHEMRIYLRRPGRNDELLTRRTTLSEGEKKLVTVLPMASAAAASAAAHDPHAVGAPRLVLLDDAFAKVSEDNHAKLFGLLVDLDVDFVVTSERLWGTHPNVPELAITEVLRDPELRAIALVHYRWNGHELSVGA
ncbi:SbcC/MukB-like Walker B domain-containing protein [Actinomycetospora termitidis]|uniref:SbcC/MukB-like Walker B domain-containing protein n=1 Tax=Actinomycetospora termitidis TaxID=3053470 RepID=A0ABT7M2R1_9PSEU|nr:SbcC/MukB-like Walker B domain-containing protein [Actinomycetospora sp. Odt1-22]MDL5154953.1 SbcC/MukB-like Walker B domain-containing protein [Actinomycetospora sp. Odt1-22]